MSEFSPQLSFTLKIGGKTLKLGRGSVYRWLSYSGIEASDIQLDTVERAQLPGAFVQSRRVGPRTITITFSVSDKKRTEELRPWLISFFNPYKPGRLKVTRSGVTRVIDFWIAGQPEFVQPNIHDDYLHVTVELLCPDPFFRDEEETVYVYNKLVPLLTFPFNTFKGAGISAGIWRDEFVATLKNDGDVPTGIHCTLYIEDFVINPKISLDDKFIRVLASLNRGDVVEIVTEAGNKTILINGEARHLYDLRSVFFEIPVGQSRLEISADDGAEHMTARFAFARRWLGV